MSNEELAAAIQAGERDKLGELWAQVERFVRRQAYRRATDGAVDHEDLYQSGFLALVKAAESYDPSRGMSFLGWLGYHLTTAFNEAQNYLTDRQRHDPIHRADSLDRPLGDAADSDTLGDITADPSGTQGFEEAEDRLWREELHTALEKALEGLPEAEGDALRRRYFTGQTLAQAAQEAGVSIERVRQRENHGLRALRHPRVTRSLREFITPYYLHVGVSRFNTSGTSSVEEIVLIRERAQNCARCGLGET
mgnify:CR=1 FL=1